MLRGRFAAAALRPLLDAGKPVDACLELLTRSKMTTLALNFKGCEAFDTGVCTRLLAHAPHGLLSLDMSHSELRPEHAAAIAEAVRTTMTGLRDLK